MRVVFYLKGAVRVDWRVPQPENFSFQMMVKLIRADGQFLAEGIYVQASEIAAIILDLEDVDEDSSRPNVGIHHPKGKVTRLVS